MQEKVPPAVLTAAPAPGSTPTAAPVSPHLPSVASAPASQRTQVQSRVIRMPLYCSPSSMACDTGTLTTVLAHWLPRQLILLPPLPYLGLHLTPSGAPALSSAAKAHSRPRVPLLPAHSLALVHRVALERELLAHEGVLAGVV